MDPANLIYPAPPALTVILPKAPVVTMITPSPPAVTIINPKPPAITIIAPRAAAVLMLVSLSSPGVQGPPGPPGPRGSLFLGGYPSFGNLPVPDGVNVKVGDFALVQDESTIYELE
jgi:hypothetical protein